MNIKFDPETGWFKCKRCRNEFTIKNNSTYYHTVCYCPYCGIKAREKKHVDRIQRRSCERSLQSDYPSG